MENIEFFINNYNTEIIIGLSIGFLLLLILFIVMLLRTNKAMKKYQQLVQDMDGVNIEEVLMGIQNKLIKNDKHILEINEEIEDLKTQLTFAIQRVGFIRYNAFDDMGSELSFSIALLDNFKNGFIISSIYGRENTTCYGKPIKNGESKIPLSAEEMIALDRAMKGETGKVTS